MSNVSGALLRRPYNGQVAHSAPGRGELHTFRLPLSSAQRDCTIELGLAQCDSQKSRAKVLLNRMYSSRGYGANHQLPSAPGSVTFVATSRDELIGTLTLTIDSPLGLALDRTFGDQMDEFRRRGAKLCELTKFAFETSAPARPRLAALFHIIFIYESAHFGCTDLFIEVNPSHRRFYELMLGFTSVGDPRGNASVNAPSQLMWLSSDRVRQFIDERGCAGAGEASRSLYSSFFSREEEDGIRARLAGLGKKPPFCRSWSGPKGRPVEGRWAASNPRQEDLSAAA